MRRRDGNVEESAPPVKILNFSLPYEEERRVSGFGVCCLLTAGGGFDKFGSEAEAIPRISGE